MARITVEDALHAEPNRFALCIIAAKRAKQLFDGAESKYKYRGNKAIVTALREVAAKVVRWSGPSLVSEHEHLHVNGNGNGTGA